MLGRGGSSNSPPSFDCMTCHEEGCKYSTTLAANQLFIIKVTNTSEEEFTVIGKLCSGMKMLDAGRRSVADRELSTEFGVFYLCANCKQTPFRYQLYIRRTFFLMQPPVKVPIWQSSRRRFKARDPPRPPPARRSNTVRIYIA